MRKLCWSLVVVAAACKSDKPGSTEAPGQVQTGLSDKERAEAVAKIDDVTITAGEFLDRINKQSPYIRARYTSLERKKEFLDTLIRFEVLAKEGLRRGLDKDPEVVRTMKQVMIQKLMKELDNHVKLTDITEEEMKKFYEEHLDEYRKPEQVRASQIVVKDKKAADKVMAEAKTKGQDSKGFRDLVVQHSIDEDSKQRGGDLRYFGKDDPNVPKPVAEATFAIEKIGDVAGPIKSEVGFHIVKLTGRRKELNRTFEEVKRQIQNRLYRDKRHKAADDFVAGLKAKAKIEIDEARLGALPIDTTTPTAPGMGGPEGPMGGGLPHGAPPEDDDTPAAPPGHPGAQPKPVRPLQPVPAAQ